MQPNNISDGWFFVGNRGPCRVPRTPHALFGYNDRISQDRNEIWTWAAWKTGQPDNLIERAFPILQPDTGTAYHGEEKLGYTGTQFAPRHFAKLFADEATLFEKDKLVFNMYVLEPKLCKELTWGFEDITIKKFTMA